MASRDQVLAASWQTDLSQAASDMTIRGVRNETYFNPPTPVYPERMMRIPGLSLSDSRIIHRSLADAGMVDAAGNLTLDPMADARWRTVIPAEYADHLSSIGDQLACCYAGHEFFSDSTTRMLDFLLNIIADCTIDAPSAFTATRGMAFSAVIRATGDPTPEFSLSDGPSGMTIDPLTGVLAWNPDEEGVFAATVRAANGVGRDDDVRITVSVGRNSGPQVDAGEDRAVPLSTGAILYPVIMDEGLPSPPWMSCTWSQTSGPASASILATGSEITRVRFSAIGTYAFTLVVSDGMDTASDMVELTVVQTGDVDGSGSVAFEDLSMFLSSYQKRLGETGYLKTADIVESISSKDIVDFDDLGLFLSIYGQPD
jgi:hypothetical protein